MVVGGGNSGSVGDGDSDSVKGSSVDGAGSVIVSTDL